MRGVSFTNVRGLCPSITGSLAELWQPGGAYDFPSSGAVLFVSSSDASDTLAGAGARTLLLQGCGSNFEQYQELIALSGSNPVPSTGTFIRLNHSNAVAVGSHGSNRGAISVRHNGTLLIAQISSGSGHDDNGIYTVPLGHTAVLRQVNAFSGFDAIVRFRFSARPGSGSAWQDIADVELHQAQFTLDSFPSTAFPATTDLKLSGQVTKVGNVNSGQVTAGFTLMLFSGSADDLEPR